MPLRPRPWNRPKLIEEYRATVGRRAVEGYYQPYELGEDEKLSPREVEIIILLSHDLRRTEIAEVLYLSIETIATHIANAKSKTGTYTLQGLVGWAYRNEVIQG